MRTLLALVLLSAWSAAAADLGGAQPVYFWPMSGAFDQYLAQQISAEGLMEVTADPKRAKSVMTESIDQKFLAGLDELFPVEEAAAETSDNSIESGLAIQRPPHRPVGRSRGALFLVDVATRKVLWSTFLGDRDSRPKGLHDDAKDVVRELKKELGQ